MSVYGRAWYHDAVHDSIVFVQRIQMNVAMTDDHDPASNLLGADSDNVACRDQTLKNKAETSDSVRYNILKGEPELNDKNKRSPVKPCLLMRRI